MRASLLGAPVCTKLAWHSLRAEKASLHLLTLLDAQIKLYEDEDRSRKDEIDALGGEDKVFSRFYDRLKDVREYHRKFPSTDLTEVR